MNAVAEKLNRKGEQARYVAREYAGMIGKTVATVRPLSDAEIEDLSWDIHDHTVAVAIIFTDGSFIIPMRDDEGNGAGTLIFENTK